MGLEGSHACEGWGNPSPGFEIRKGVRPSGRGEGKARKKRRGADGRIEDQGSRLEAHPQGRNYHCRRASICVAYLR